MKSVVVIIMINLYMMKLPLLKEEDWLMNLDGNLSSTGSVSLGTYQVKTGAVTCSETGGMQMLG